MTNRRKRFPLQLKVSVALALIVTVPLSIAYFLVGQLGKTAANVAASDASARIEAMDNAMRRYHELVNVTKRVHGEIAERLARRAERGALSTNTADLTALLEDPGMAGLRAVAAWT